jgi:hypothetical protein
MVTRISGAPAQGFWFGADILTVFIDATNGTFLTDLTVTSTDPRQADAPGSGLEQVVEVMQRRCTVIGMNVTAEKTIEFLIGYGHGFTVGNTENTVGSLEEEIADAITAIDTPTDLNGTEIAVFDGFIAASLGTPV